MSKINCNDDVSEAFNKIKSGSQPSAEEFYKYAQSIYENTFHLPVTLTHFQEKIKSVKNIEQCMRNTARFINKTLQRYYDN